MSRRNIFKYKLGLVGDSTVEHFPLEDLEDEDIDPIVLSCSPKRARRLVHSGRLNDIIHYTLDRHPDLDAVFIFIGGNDVAPSCEVREILGNILEIAQSFEEIGIPQIIMPLMNRTTGLHNGTKALTEQVKTLRKRNAADGLDRSLSRQST